MVTQTCVFIHEEMFMNILLYLFYSLGCFPEVFTSIEHKRLKGCKKKKMHFDANYLSVF